MIDEVFVRVVTIEYNETRYDWNLVKIPAGAYQWISSEPVAANTLQDAHDPNKRHASMMTTADLKWTGKRVDLIFGSNSELRSIVEVYASDDDQHKFI